MKKYNVHLYAVVRVLVKDVDASNQTSAMNKARKKVWNDLYDVFSSPPGRGEFQDRGINQIEFAEEIEGYLVDEVGDEEYKNSHFYDKEMRRTK